MKCNHCDRGVVRWRDVSPQGDHDMEYEEECPECGGTGVNPNQQEVTE